MSPRLQVVGRGRRVLLAVLALACGARADPREHVAIARKPGDSYLSYLLQAPEFRPVRRVPAGRWDTWLYMPWRYRWPLGTGDEAGRFCRAHGINGGVVDHGHGPLAWLERFGLRFYGDHTAGKGALYLGEAARAGAARAADPRAVRPRPLDAALRTELEATIERNVRALRGSPLRVAYALDDEVSWGSFTRPLPWRVDADDAGYARWLARYHPGAVPRTVTPEQMRGQLGRPLGEIDFSPLLDRMSYNDSVWANLLGGLVEHANRLDPETPCGIVGGQAPSLWGGYDYAKLMKKVQFFEAYDRGSAPEIARSLAPEIPRVLTHFYEGGAGAADTWFAWRHFAHGARGLVGWVEGWFDGGGRPRSWLDRFGRTLAELGAVQGPKLAGARWLHDGIAIYYSHPSIQVSWLLDAEPHGATWPRRYEDDRLGTSHLVRRAWELLLDDAGLRYGFVSYDEVAIRGVPAEYRVLILPAAYALSDAEARRIEEFALRGGTVIADFAAGLFDPYGRGRREGALDRLFGVRHDGTETRRDLFAGRLWVETDQEAGYGARTYAELFATLAPRLDRGYAVAERRLGSGSSRRAGRGRAVYLNLSPQRYLLARERGRPGDATRRSFLEPIREAGVVPWITVRGGLPRDLEITAWSKGGRTLVFLLQHPETRKGASGRPVPRDLVDATVPVGVELAGDVRDAVDERTGRSLGSGRRFAFRFPTAEAVFWSFAGPPPKAGARPAQR